MTRIQKQSFSRIATVCIAALLVLATALQLVMPSAFGRRNVQSVSDGGVRVSFTDAENGLGADYRLQGTDAATVTSAPKADEEVTVIVSLGGTPMMQFATARNLSVAEALATDAGKANLAKLDLIRANALDRLSPYIRERRFEYTTVLNAFSATVRYGDVAKIEADRQVKNVILSNTYSAPDGVTENYVDVYETGIFDSSDVGYDGTGTVVAVLDTGTDYTHEVFDMELDPDTLAITKDDVAAVAPLLTATSFSQAQGENVDEDDLYLTSKLPFAYDYADSDANVYPFESHGTHVAGIIAGKSDTITGVAPAAQIATFKVFSDSDEGAQSEGIIAALNDAVTLGVDVINMSLGSSCGFSREGDEDAINEVYDSINDAGVCLVVAASNSYSSAQNSTWGNTNLASNPDSGTLGSPATYPASLAVASVSGVKTKYFTVNGKEIYFNESRLLGKTDPNDFVGGLLGDDREGEFEYVVIPGIGLSVNYTDIDVAGKIAVVKRGTSSFEEKVRVAYSKGAAGVIVYNNISGTITMSVGTKELIPSCFVNMDLAEYILAESTGTIHLSQDYLAGPFMSDFSSWGVLPDLGLSPDITAHGGDILSAVAGGNLYDLYSGTSMASPNLAGALVLVRQYVKENNPSYGAHQVRDESYSRMMSTATIVRNEDGNPYSPRKQGAGLANIAGTVTTKAYLTVDGSNKPKLSLGDDPARTGVYTMTFNLVNASGESLSYKLNPYVMTESMSVDERTVAEKAHLFTDTVNTYSVQARQGNAWGNGDVVSVGGYGEAEITVTIRLSDADKKYLDANFVNGMYVEGYVRLESYNADKIDLSIPYLAFYGDWKAAPMLDVTAYAVGESEADDSVLPEDKLVADVYGTLPLAGFASETSSNGIGSLGMGQFSYIPASGYEDSVPDTQEKYAALTTDPEGNFMFYAVSAGLLRCAKKVVMEIRNSATGELLWSGIDYNARKSYANGEQLGGYVVVELNIAELGLANNAKYTFEMACYLDIKDENGDYTYGNRNTFSFEFTVDNEKPQLIDTAVRESKSGSVTNRYLDLTVFDNHYLQGFSLATYASKNGDDLEGVYNFSNGVIPVESEYNGNTVVTFDITSYWTRIVENDYKLYLNLYDYANNTRSFFIDLSPENDLTIAKTRTASDSYTVATGEQIDLEDYIIVRANVDETLTDDADKSYVEGYWHTDLHWVSSDDSTVEVKDGLVTGLREGQAVVTVYVDGATAETLDPTKRLQFTVKVTSAVKELGMTGIKMSADALALERGETATITAEIEPYNYTGDYTVAWTSTSANVKILETGKDASGKDFVTVQAMQSGSATVRATVEGTRISGYCAVRVAQEFSVYETVYLRSYKGRGDENGVVEIPDDLGVSYIYQGAFNGNEHIKKVIIPEGVTTVMRAAIAFCDELEEVVLPSTVETIEEAAFAFCPKLKKINLQDVKTIGSYAFYGCEALEEVNFVKCTYISEFAFYQCAALKTLDLSRVGVVGGAAFAFCDGLTELVIPANTSTTSVLATGESNDGQEIETDLGAFYGCGNLTALTVYADTVGPTAFAFCENLRSVTFKNDVKLVGEFAFGMCAKLDRIVFEKTAYKIDDSAFMGCSALTSFRIPNGLTVLGSGVFINSGVTRIEIDKGARLTDVALASLWSGTLGSQNLVGKLTAFAVEEGNEFLSSDANGVLYDKNKVKLIAYPCGRKNTAFTVPDSVKTIGTAAFYATDITSINLRNVEYIESNAFADTGLSTVSGFANVKYIGQSAFAGTSITTLPVTDATLYIGDYAFSTCMYLGQGFTAPKHLSYLGDGAFERAGYLSELSAALGGGTAFTSVSFADSDITEIGNGVFSGCSTVTDVDFGNLEKIGDYMFDGCTALTSVTVPNTVKALGAYAFYGCTNLSAVEIPASVTSIAPYAFAKSGLTSVTLNSGVVSIASGAFSESKLTAVTLGNVDYIGDGAFAKTPLLSVVSDTVTHIGNGAFSGCSSLATARFAGARNIGADAFADCAQLISVELPSAVSIGNGAFAGCAALQNVTLDAAVSIGDRAFAGAQTLSDISFGAVRSIGDRILADTAVTSVTLPASVQRVADNAFAGAARLTAIAVNDGCAGYLSDDGVLYRVHANGYYTLLCYPAGKTDAAYAVLDKTVMLGASSFENNTYLETLELPVYLQVMGAAALDGTTSLTEIVLNAPEALTLESMLVGEGDEKENVYANFGAVRDDLRIVIPANNLLYNNHVWQSYVGDKLEVSEYLHITVGTLGFIERVRALPEKPTVADADEIAMLMRMYNILNAAQKAFAQGNYAYTAGGSRIDSAYYTELLGGIDYYQVLVDKQNSLQTQPTEPTEPPKSGCKSMLSTDWTAVTGALVLAAAMGILFLPGRRKHEKD